MSKIIFLNQSSGKLFTELAEDIANYVDQECILSTGSYEVISQGRIGQLKIRPAPQYQRNYLFTRLMSWLKYIFDALWFCLSATNEDFLFIVSNPPLTTPLAWLIKIICGTRYIVLIYDIHPDILVALGKISAANPITKLWKKINCRAWENAVAVITIGDFMASHLEQQFNSSKTNAGRVLVVPVWSDTKLIKPIGKSDNYFLKELGLSNKKIILYSGNFGISHDIQSILEACYLLKDRDDIHFLLIGQGEKWQDSVHYQQRNKLDNLSVLPYQPISVYPYSIAAADIALVALEKEVQSLMLPSKTFASMAAGSAIVGICGNKNDLHTTIINNRCGICVDPKQPQQLADALLEIVDSKKKLEEFKDNSRKAAEFLYSRQAQQLSFVNIMKNLDVI